MEPRYRLFKSDINFDLNLLANNSTPSPGISDYQGNGIYSHSTNNTSHQIGIQDWNQMFPKWKQILGEDASKLPSGPSQSPLLLLNNQQAAVSLLSNVLNQSNSLSSKCEQISRMFSSFSNKELIELYPQLLIEIFGFNGNQTFGLNKYEPHKYCYDFDAAYSFLSTNGCLFKVINKLLVDQEAEFHFPYKGLPAAIVEKINNGHISMWYQNKLMVLRGDEVVLSCNAFEYYVLLFAYYLIHPHTLDQPSQWSGIEDVLYIRLLEDYLEHFFPIDAVNDLTSTIPAETKHVVSSSDLWKTFDYGSPANNQSSPYGSSLSLQNIMPSSHAEVFLQILCDIWFGLNAEIPFQEEEYKLPSVDHARVVRILVKYLHMFVNGNSEVQMILFSSTHNQHIDEFKSVVIPALMHKSLYIYLKHCFTHWPLDGSFRMILETWLSFIQPWRYGDTNNNKSMNDSVEINISKWKSFVRENILFYSSMFQMFLLRALRFDMNSLHDVQLMYRVAKVFSQSSLYEILQDETKQQVQSQINSRSVGGPMFLGLMSTAKKNQFEKPGKDILSIFGPEITKPVQDLCQMITSTVIAIRQKNTQTAEGKKTTVLACIREFFLIDDTGDYDDCENQRLIEYLEETCMLFSSMFKLPEFQTPIAVSGEYLDNDTTANLSRATVEFLEDSLPDFTVTENGVELTDVGRYQILQGIRQFPITYSGDPEHQPIRSYESLLAVKGLYWIACKLNTKCSNVLHKLYNLPGYNNFLQRFSKRLNTNHYVNTPFNLPQSTKAIDKVTPRISLRFAASYYFMGYVCWVIILARLFGFSWLIILCALFILAITSIVVHLDSPPKKFS